MVKKAFLIAAATVLVSAAPVFAVNSHAKNTADMTEASTVSPTDTQGCDPNANWKNHGEYVNCVAHLHEGGQTTSSAAKSSTGKKTSTVSGTGTPEVSLTITPEASSSPTPDTASLSGTITPTETNTTTSFITKPIHGVMHFFQSLFSKLINLI